MNTDKKTQMNTDKKTQMNTDKKCRWTYLSVFICFIICVNLCINSTDAYCLNVSPGRIEINVAPSKTYEDVLRIGNTEKGTMEVALRVEDWHKAVEGNADKNPRQSASFEWLRLSPIQFGLKGGETREVRLKVTVPKGAKGELNGMLFIEARPKELGEGAIGINTSIGVPIYVMIKGTERYKAEVEDLKVVRQSPLELAITIKNSGNVHIRPTGTIEIFNADLRKSNADKRRLTIPLNEYNYPVLPFSSRTLEINAKTQLEEGEYLADIRMGFGDRRYRKKIAVTVK